MTTRADETSGSDRGSDGGGSVLDARMRTSIACVAVCGATLALGAFFLLDRGAAGSVANEHRIGTGARP